MDLVRVAPTESVDGRTTRLASRTGLVYAAAVVAGIGAGAHWVRPLHLGLDGSPFVGDWRWPLRPSLLLPAVVGAAVVLRGPTLVNRLSWRAVPVASGVTAVVWAVALGASDGWAQLTTPVTNQNEYERFAATIDHPLAFLRGFVGHVPGYPIHVRAHPPLATLVPWGLDHIGLAGAGWFAALLIMGWGVGIAAVVVALKEVAGEAAARRAAPALVLLPAAVWAATSSDALFAGVIAVGIAVAVGGTRRRAWWGGVLLGLALLMTYGGAVLLLVPVVVHLRHRRFGHVGLITAGVACTLVVVRVTTGFWWLDGLRATQRTYWDGVASVRPGLFLTVVGNPTALAVAIGPAAVVGLVLAVRSRGWASPLLPLAAVAAVTMADVSQLSRGEVERIWLPFAVWIAAAAVGDRRGWLAAQAGVGLAAQALLVSPW